MLYNSTMTKDELLKVVDDYLKLYGFRKKGLSWYKENPETITVFSLDRSRWGGEMYYAYLSVNFLKLNPEIRPKFYKCHSNLRGEHLDESIKEYLDLESK